MNVGINNRDCVKQLAEIAGVQQELRTGHTPKQVDVAFAGDALVMILHDALTTAEKKVSQDPHAASQLKAFHRELFLSSSNTMNQEIARVTGRTVRETVGEMETESGSLVYAAATGVMIQVYMLNPEANPDTSTLNDQHDSDSIERAEDDGLRITPPQDD
jgi:uncharacterized protein YbcI